VLIAGGNLIRKVLFPAEVLPIVTVLAGLVHFLFGLPILAAFFLYYGVPLATTDLLWLPLVIAIQLILTLGLALLVSALTVHFRDLRDLLANLMTLWFFATPIVYPLSQAPERVRRLLNLNPFTHLAVAYQEVLFVPGSFAQWPRLLAIGAASIVVLMGWLCRVRSPARYARGGSVNAIEVRDVRKIYRRYGRRKHFGTLKSALLSGGVLRQMRPDDVLEALNGVSFDVGAGRTFGIIGRNGSGKSTMLKLIAGIGKPTSGAVRVNGRVSALIELGAGFHPEISGRENVFINGMMLGLTKREIAERFDEIVSFAELEPFIDAPVKTYSSGMYMRLGFAVAINVDPDVLLVDEVLAVGDEAFTHKCLDKFAEFRRRGRTVLLVTHTLDLVTRFCDEALWLDAGTARAHGDPKRVIDAYLMDVAAAEDAGLSNPKTHIPKPKSQEEGPGEPEDLFKASEGRWGSREVEITAVEFLARDGRPAHVFQSGDPVQIRMRVQSRRTGQGLRVRDRDLHRRRRLLLRHEHAHRGRRTRGVVGRGRDHALNRSTRSRGRLLQSRRRRASSERRSLRLSPAALHAASVLLVERHRNLPTAASMDVFWRHPDRRTPLVRAAPRHVSSPDEAASFARGIQHQGGVVVFTNGVFDLLHPGHIRAPAAGACARRCVDRCGQFGSIGPRARQGCRPAINPQHERVEVVLGLGSVDAAVIFDEDTAARDHQSRSSRMSSSKAQIGAPMRSSGVTFVEGRGGRVVRIEIVGGYSTTDIIHEVRSAKQKTEA
jgi:ABC-type polysaccharide/polyol phosphate transport system ATPase subunit